jgi:CheY-like chemotaxis protein
MGLLAHRKGLKFDYTLEGHVPVSVISDKILLQDILHRVLDNAIRFTESGSIGLVVTATESGLDWVVLTFDIADTGRGIAKEILFANLESLPSRLPRHGLGLMIVRNSLTGLGGEMSVISNSASGTTLRITIPTAIAHIDTPAMPATPALSAFVPSQLRLLVAEDSNDSFLLFQSYLKAEGHHITRALNGAEAVEMVKTGGHDFIVMDVHMPVMDGYTATRLIRDWETEQGRARLPILLLSADDLATQIRIGAVAGCSGYLAKPTNKAQVLGALAYYANPGRVPRLTRP